MGLRGSVPSSASSSIRKASHCSVEPAPDQEAEDPPPLSSRQCRAPALPTPWWASRARCGQAARLVLLLGPQAAPRDEQLLLVRRELLAQQRHVAGAVRHGAQERVHVGRRRSAAVSTSVAAPPCCEPTDPPAGGLRGRAVSAHVLDELGDLAVDLDRAGQLVHGHRQRSRRSSGRPCRPSRRSTTRRRSRPTRRRR